MLPKYSEEEIKKAESMIYSYIEKDYNLRGVLASAKGVEMPKDLTNSILYESSFDECIWGEGNWNSLSGNGCRFFSCDFFTNEIHNVALQHTLFDNSIFYNCDLKGSNFAYSTFSWSIMKKCPINGCAFTGTIFNHVTFQDSVIAHSNFELCKFQNTHFKNIDFSNLALKYTFFQNVTMENVTLPFMQIPYTFGGMTYVFSTKDNIKIATTSEGTPIISVSEYKKILPQLITFFSGHNEYFPLANCYFINKQYKLAQLANEMGIVNSATLHDFRKLYFFCVQATQELKISKTRRCELYNRINQLLSSVELNRAEYQEFQHYFPMIKHLMFDNPNNKPTLLLSFHTNIKSDDFENLGLLMRILDELAEQCGVFLDSKHMEIRHNSPNIVDWLPIGDIEQLLQLLQNTWDVIYPILSNSIQDIANVATVVTGLHGLHKLRQDRKKQNQKTVKTVPEENNKVSISNNQNIIPDRMETLNLRISLLKQEQDWQQNKKINPKCSVQQSEIIVERFKEKIKQLKSAGIYINTLEIQILDEQGDALDHLYNSNIQLS